MSVRFTRPPIQSAGNDLHALLLHYKNEPGSWCYEDGYEGEAACYEA
jgi:hypothetical protein